MPQIHGGLTNEDFVLAMTVSNSKGMTLSEWITSIVVKELHKEKGE